MLHRSTCPAGLVESREEQDTGAEISHGLKQMILGSLDGWIVWFCLFEGRDRVGAEADDRQRRDRALNLTVTTTKADQKGQGSATNSNTY